MRQRVKLPRVSDTIDEVVVVQWFSAVGDSVVNGQPLLSVETDKVTVEIPSPTTGTVVELLVAEDDEVSTGDVICVVETG